MNKEYDKIIADKIKQAKSRAAKKRNWIALHDSYLDSSINYRFTLEERGVWPYIIIMANKFGPVPGLISDNDFRPMPHDYLAHQACVPFEVFESVLKKGIEDDSLYENSHGIFVTHFDDYQFTEYDRQKPYRDKKKELNQDPDKFVKGKYGDTVRR